MALTYRNTLRGHVATVPEPADIIAAAQEEAERLFRKGTPEDRLAAERLLEKARARAKHQRQTLAKMDQSRRWERYTAPPVVEAPAPEPVQTGVEEPVKAPTKAAKAAPKAAEPEA